MSLFQHKAALPVVVVAVIAAIGGLVFYVNRAPDAPIASQVDSSTVSGDASAETNPLITPRVLGAADAPVTIIEYSSLTCPHCATFHRETLPKLKETYIDTGKVKLELRDFPLDDGATLGALLARCAPEDRYFALIDLLFLQQRSWARSENLVGELARLGGFAGMPEATIQACFENEELFKAIREQRQVWASTHEITSTPTFIVNGTKVSGAQPFEEFQKIIDGALN
ncbi:DsbA family protein [Pacificispira sp.]|uniref:DsbA family protein n=1 Tax=Pacificispira sp. TaxID=2888761 RepID=UPI003BAC070A